MDRNGALALSLMFLFVFFLICYYGMKVTWYSSLALAILTSLIYLNMYYPLSKIPVSNADFSLILYGCYQIIGFLILIFYVVIVAILDTRKNKL